MAQKSTIADSKPSATTQDIPLNSFIMHAPGFIDIHESFQLPFFQPRLKVVYHM
jgi:hypothetical protein